MADEPARFVLGIAYQAGPDPRIKRGVDGGRDYFSKAELERACWSYMRSGCPQINAFHVDGTEDCAEPVESFIWRWPDWDVGDGIVVKDGDWCLGAILSPRMWDLHKAGKVNGLSPQGTARRRRVLKEGAVAVAKGSIDLPDLADDEDEFTELLDANVPTVALVGAGANGIPRFLITKQQGVGLMDPDYVRGLLAKSEPTHQPQEAVTLSGSPAAIAALIHGAPVRKAEPVPGDVAKAEASTASLNDRDDSDFAYIESGGTKDESGKTTPRSLRHFPIYDAAHVRNALSRAPQSPFGDKAMPKIRAAAKKFGIDVSKEIDMAVVTGETDDGIDGMDPTVVLAEPDGDAPGDPMEPGSPAWEAIDAATARKWTSILVRAKNALGVMADREMLEAATADPDDAESAWDLQDAQCAIDYVIDTLAGFAVGEQAEADLGGEAMDALGKALGGFDTAALDTIESLTLVRKAGRVLSAANEAAIRGAVESLQKVLASLPQAPTADEDGGRAVAKTANEESDMPTPTTSAETTEASGQAPAMGARQPEATPPAGTVVSEVAKAKGDPQLVVYDESGKLLGIVDPGDLTPVANAGAAEPDGDGGVQAPDDAPAASAPPTDLTPAPPAEVGIPAEDVTDDTAAMTKNTPETTLGESTSEGLLKAALQDFGAQQAQVLKAALQELDQRREAQIDELTKDTGERISALTKQVEQYAERNSQLQETVAKQAAQITALENAPATREVVRNGQLPPDHLLRGQQYGAAASAIDIAKAQQRRAALYAASTAAEQNQIAREMNADAITALQAIHAGQ